MKKYISLSIASLFVLAMTISCSFLVEDPKDRMELEKSLNTEEEAILFLYGAHYLVKNTVFGQEFYSATDMMTDDVDFASTDITRRQLSFMTYNPTNKTIKAIWGKFYAVIEQCNVLINNLNKKPDLYKTSGQLLMAEARFMRAWAYFNLVQLWGDVPLVTIPMYNIKKDNLYPKRSKVESVYSLIISDLEFAVANVGEKAGSITFKTDITYPLVLRKAAAKLLLGKTYLLSKQYEEAVAELSYFGQNAQNLNPDFGLIGQFNYIYDVRYKSVEERKREILWEAEARAEVGLNNTIHREMAPAELKDSRGAATLVGKSTGYQNYLPTIDLINSFDQQKDVRYKQGYQLSKSAPDTRPHIMKGYDVLTLDQNTGGPNAILLRVADAYLVMAEALNELGAPDQAKGFVDIIRTRAGLTPLASSLTKEQMAEAILLERRHEFAHEGPYRLFDLRRTGQYKQVMQNYIAKQSAMLAGTDGEADIAQKVKLYDPISGILTNEINIPFMKVNKFWSDKLLLHAVPNDERISNTNLTVKDNWN